MHNKNDNHIHDSNSLFRDVQDRQSEVLPPIQECIEGQHNIVMKEKKSHGNRKLQHFKRKCRARGLNEEQIETLIDTRHHAISEQLLNDQTANNQTKKSTKRKRDQSEQDLLNSSIKSLSQLSISPAVSKKAKNSTQKTILSTSSAHPLDSLTLF
jgi:spore cortex formation protein SpoVR/YcgB (stage V sporulation)